MATKGVNRAAEGEFESDGGGSSRKGKDSLMRSNRDQFTGLHCRSLATSLKYYQDTGLRISEDRRTL